MDSSRHSRSGSVVLSSMLYVRVGKIPQLASDRSADIRTSNLRQRCVVVVGSVHADAVLQDSPGVLALAKHSLCPGVAADGGVHRLDNPAPDPAVIGLLPVDTSCEISTPDLFEVHCRQGLDALVDQQGVHVLNAAIEEEPDRTILPNVWSGLRGAHFHHARRSAQQEGQASEGDDGTEIVYLLAEDVAQRKEQLQYGCTGAGPNLVYIRRWFLRHFLLPQYGHAHCVPSCLDFLRHGGQSPRPRPSRSCPPAGSAAAAAPAPAVLHQGLAAFFDSSHCHCWNSDYRSASARRLRCLDWNYCSRRCCCLLKQKGEQDLHAQGGVPKDAVPLTRYIKSNRINRNL